MKAHPIFVYFKIPMKNPNIVIETTDLGNLCDNPEYLNQ